MKNATLILLLICTAFSLLEFIACGVDKLLAKRSAWRIPEKFFLWLSVIGGAPGLSFGMLTFHHKTSHWYFCLFAVLFGVLWLGLIAFMLLKTAALL